MRSTQVHPSHRPVRVLVDIALRAGGLVAATAVLTSFSDETDALALGLSDLFTLVGLAFVAASLDALRQRNRARLYLVWAVVVPLVGVLRTAADLHWRVTRPGAYQSLTQVPLDDSLGTWLLWTVAPGLPVLVGIVLGVLVRPFTRLLSPGPSQQR